MLINHKRTAYRIIRELTNVLDAVPLEALPYVARGLSDTYKIPKKPMLQVMRRYTRLYR